MTLWSPSPRSASPGKMPSWNEEEARMEKISRTCPACGNGDYQFRSRKKVAQEGKEAVETRYRCKACNHEWKVKVPG
jgi:transposase-like protein